MFICYNYVSMNEIIKFKYYMILYNNMLHIHLKYEMSTYIILSILSYIKYLLSNAYV